MNAKLVYSKQNLIATLPLLPVIPLKPVLTLHFRNYFMLFLCSSLINIIMKHPTIDF